MKAPAWVLESARLAPVSLGVLTKSQNRLCLSQEIRYQIFLRAQRTHAQSVAPYRACEAVLSWRQSVSPTHNDHLSLVQINGDDRWRALAALTEALRQESRNNRGCRTRSWPSGRQALVLIWVRFHTYAAWSGLLGLVWTKISGVKGALALSPHWRIWNQPEQKRCSVGYCQAKPSPAGRKQFFGRFGRISGHLAASWIKRDKHRSIGRDWKRKTQKNILLKFVWKRQLKLQSVKNAKFNRASNIFTFIFSTRKAPHETGTMLIVKQQCPSMAPSCSHFGVNLVWGL